MPAENNSDLSIANRALRKAFLSPIASFSEESDKAELIAGVYTEQRALLLSLTHWNFARKFVQLSRDPAAPAAQWSYAFKLPPDREGVPDAYFATGDESAPPVKQFELAEDMVLANSETLWARYTFSAPENLWPPYFVSFAVAAIAAEICNDKDRRRELAREAWGIETEGRKGGAYRIAKQRDGAYTRTRPLFGSGGGPLIDVRGGT